MILIHVFQGSYKLCELVKCTNNIYIIQKLVQDFKKLSSVLKTEKKKEEEFIHSDCFGVIEIKKMNFPKANDTNNL